MTGVFLRSKMSITTVNVGVNMYRIKLAMAIVLEILAGLAIRGWWIIIGGWGNHGSDGDVTA